MLARLLIRWLTKIHPEKRRMAAALLLEFTLYAWPVCHLILELVNEGGFFNHVVMAISWWAVSVTACDVVQTTDVKVDTADSDPTDT